MWDFKQSYFDYRHGLHMSSESGRRNEMRGLTDADEFILNLPNVATGQIVALNSSNEIIYSSDPITRTANSNFGVSVFSPFADEETAEPTVDVPADLGKTQVTDRILKQAAKIILVYKHVLMPRGRPDVALTRLRGITEFFPSESLKSMLIALQELSSADSDIRLLHGFLKSEYEREIVQTRGLEKFNHVDGSILRLGLRLNGLSSEISKQRRHIEAVHREISEVRQEIAEHAHCQFELLALATYTPRDVLWWMADLRVK